MMFDFYSFVSGGFIGVLVSMMIFALDAFIDYCKSHKIVKK